MSTCFLIRFKEKIFFSGIIILIIPHILKENYCRLVIVSFIFLKQKRL